ncbi:mannose-6-phosphate isomerase [Thamnocephalis sphaerospora]|uniref:Mannose-6-phosphate isomerase n=1 Tax=Thamnocephalis sphaerospora TaxID=78915 RepID=A0A4P9XZ76_9FUNG|nr:mannose-6-phosphate isomerase [Thamnocephalis sphaerospora]|eukprot:RKP11051.1 mannose-6-phosphate isomerase [Thamnocephalis sphaerospora]
MTNAIPPVFALRCQVQQYDWGKLGVDSSVAQYAGYAHGAAVSADQPYAELWMGTHPNAPAIAQAPGHAGVDGRPLGELVTAQPTRLLTDGVASAYHGDLPFLFKVLSIRKALSIQAHPDKVLAAELHARRPDQYRDANHKPEMTIALTDFEAMCGFRPASDIMLNVQAPELVRLVGEDVIKRFCDAANAAEAAYNAEDDANVKRTLSDLFGQLMRSDRDRVEEAVTKLCARFARLPAANVRGSLEETIIRLNGQFPGDIGCLCPLLLNLVQLQPGDALFLSANEPHAYISGDCIECMATSDNVVRAGLTPKFIDVDVLVNMLTYTTRSVEQVKVTPQPWTRALGGAEAIPLAHTAVYDPPIPEFAVARTLLNNASETFAGVQGPSVLIVTHGSGRLSYRTPDGAKSDEELILRAGQVYFIAPDTVITLAGHAIQDEADAFQCYRAYCEV